MKYLVLLSALLLNVSCLAQSNQPAQAEMDLDCTAVTINAELDDCIKRSMIRSNQALKNKITLIEQQVIRDYQADEQLGNALVGTIFDAQKAWLAYRGSNCKVVAFEIEEGTAAYISTVNSCIIEMNDERIEQLSRQFN